MWYIYHGIWLNHKKDRNNAICSNMDGPGDYIAKWSYNSEKDKYRYNYMQNLKKWYKELIYKTETHSDVENEHMVTKQKSRVGRRINLGV